MALNKRGPDTFDDYSQGGTFARFEALSKADWADLYADLYRQVNGETASAETIMADAERRDDFLRYARGQKPRKHPTKRATA